VDPEEGADTTALGTRWHTRGNLEVRETRPNAGLVDTEHRKVLRLNRPDIALVRNGQRTTLKIIQPLGVIRLGARVWADIVHIVLVTDIAPFGRGEERSGSLVAGDFCRGWFARWEVEDVPCVGGEIEVVVEPPLGERHVFDRCNWSIIVWKGFVSYVEPEHAWMPES